MSASIQEALGIAEKATANLRSYISQGGVLVGSTVTCNPIPEDADIDVLLCIPPKLSAEFVEVAKAVGFEEDGAYFDTELHPDRMGFFSLRRADGDVNLIVTGSAEFFRRFVGATMVCEQLNLQGRLDRIALFQAILYEHYDGKLRAV